MQKLGNLNIHIVIIRLILILVFVMPYYALAQTTITLKGAISLAQQNSIQATLNKNTYEVSNLTYQLQRVQLFPQVNLNANLPGYNSSITSVTQPDGTIKFTTVEQAYSNIGVSLNQKIAATGGAFTASSNINRFDMLTGNRNRTFSIFLCSIEFLLLCNTFFATKIE